MSSFLSDSAIGIGGSDSRGLIQQPRRILFVVPSIVNPLPQREWGLHIVLVESLPLIVILPHFASTEVRKISGCGDVRASPCVWCSHSVGSSSSPPTVAGYEWVRDDVLKYKSALTSALSVVALQCQVKLASHEDSCKIVVQACGSDDFPFLKAVSGSPPFFFTYRCLFEVLGLVLPLIVFQCALLEHLNVAPS